MSDHSAALDVRAKMLGVLMRDARQHAGRTAKECAELLGVKPGVYNAYENGAKSASLPEIELLAYFLEVPLAHFWGNTALTEKPDQRPQVPAPALTELRDRMIGAKLRQARTTDKLKIKEFAADLGISAGLLSAYEFGQKPIPLPELEVIANRLSLKMDDLLENQGVVGDWESAQRLFERFKQLPSDLREFVVEPVNAPYLRLAQRLSQMSAEQLRSIAAGLLDITY
jgi:transcriptional regulator with XRE-family HTH domain